MICINCGTDNPDEKLYCKECGEKIDYDRDEIEAQLAAKANREAEENLEEQTRGILVGMICLFLVVLTLRFMYSSDDWAKTIVLPKSMENAPHEIRSFEHTVDDLTPDKNEIAELPLPENTKKTSDEK